MLYARFIGLLLIFLIRTRCFIRVEIPVTFCAKGRDHLDRDSDQLHRQSTIPTMAESNALYYVSKTEQKMHVLEISWLIYKV